MLPPRANGRKDEGAARRSCARRCDDRCSQNAAPRFAQNPNGEIIIDPAAPANSNCHNNDPTMISRQQQRSSSRPSSPAHSAHDGGAEEEDHHQQTPGASSSVRSLVKNRTFSHPLFGDDDQTPSSTDIATTGASTEGDEASGSGGLSNPHATATETKASFSSSSFNNAILSDSSASGGGAAAAALLSEQAFGPSRSSSTRRSAPLTLEQRRKHKRSSARSATTAAAAGASATSSSSRSSRRSKKSLSSTANSECNGGSSQQDDCSAAAESEERSTLERQLIQLKVELAQVKSESEEWRHAHGTVSEENHGLRFQLGVMLDLEDESHARQKVLEEEVRQLRFEAEERERAEQVRAKVEAQRRAEAQRQREKEEKADLQQRRSGSFSSIGDILTHLIGDDNGGEGTGRANDDDDSCDPYSSETKRDDHKRQNSVEALLGMSGLDEDDVRYAAAHERDCLLRENDRLKIDLDGAVSERDELRARVAELEKKELERTQREAHAHAAAANQRAPLHSAGGGGESSSSSASCTDAASSGASCSPSTPPTAAPPSSLRGYLSKVTSTRMLTSGGGSNKNFNKNQSSGGGRSITPPIVAIPPESLLWDSEDDLNVSVGRGQWSRAA